MSADYGGNVEQVHAAFSDRQYWLARLAGSGADDATLESIRLGGPDGLDGSVEVVTTQVIRADRLPGVVTQFHRGDLRIRREENWGPVSGGVANATIMGTIAGAPVALSGTAELAPIAAAGGARLKFWATVEVRIPLVGGKVENFIGRQLVELLIAEQRFTTFWIAQQI